MWSLKTIHHIRCWLPRKVKCQKNKCFCLIFISGIILFFCIVVMINKDQSEQVILHVETTTQAFDLDLDSGLSSEVMFYISNYKQICEDSGSKYVSQYKQSTGILGTVKHSKLQISDDSSTVKEHGAHPSMLRVKLANRQRTIAQPHRAVRDKEHRKQRPCPCVPSTGLNPLDTDSAEDQMWLPWEHIEVSHHELSLGGAWSPRHCIPRQHVAIIVPYRDRERHLKGFISIIHGFLQRQLVAYQIFVIEQESPQIFNRAALMNIGYLEARKHAPFDCYIFHDVDLLPETDLNFYTCHLSPLHIGAYMSKFNYTSEYMEFFGGAIALTQNQIELINGFPNRFYGWGGEDDDIYHRLLERNLTIHKHPAEIGRTYMFRHEEDKLNPRNPRRLSQLEKVKYFMETDGINSIQYTTHHMSQTKLYTRLLVSIERIYDQDCILDETKPPSASDNYLDCYTEDNFVVGLLDCCRYMYGDGVYCCDKTEHTGTLLIWIFAAILLTLSCSTLIFTALLLRKKKLHVCRSRM